MSETMASPIMVAETNARNANHLLTILKGFDQWAIAVESAEEAMALLRKRLVVRAIVAAELEIDGESLLARLTRLPALRTLLAVGAPGDADRERLARQAGAHVFLTRPVTAEQLAAAVAWRRRRSGAAVDPEQSLPGRVGRGIEIA